MPSFIGLPRNVFGVLRAENSGAQGLYSSPKALLELKRLSRVCDEAYYVR